MAGRTVRSQLFLSTGAVVVLCILASVFIVSMIVDNFCHEEISRNLTHGRQVFEGYLRVKNSLLRDKGRSLAQTPYLKATISIEDLDQETAHYTAATLQEIADTELLLLIDHRGAVLADAAKRTPFGFDLSQRPRIGLGLKGEESTGIWKHQDKVYLMAVSPVIEGSSVLGVVVTGAEVGLPLADEVREATGRDVMIFSDLNLAATSKADPSSPAPSQSELQRLRAWVANTGMKIEPKMSTIDVWGHTCLATAIPLDSVTVILSRPLDAFAALYHRAQSSLLFVGLTMGIVALLVSRQTAHSLSRPIQALVQASTLR